jgi:uncharacterized UBP type Zn finger protein
LEESFIIDCFRHCDSKVVADVVGTLMQITCCGAQTIDVYHNLKYIWQERFPSWVQSDPHEFFLYFLDKLSTGLLFFKKKKCKKKKPRQFACSHLMFLAELKSPLCDSFRTKLQLKTSCLACDGILTSEEEYITLDIIPQNNDTATTQELVARLWESESIHAKCGNCSETIDVQKNVTRTGFLRCPLTLVLKLNIWKYNKTHDGNLVCTLLDCSVTPSLKLTVPRADGTQSLYTLGSCIIFSGDSPNSGHYVMYGRGGFCANTFTNCWNKYDDAEISSETSLPQVIYTVTVDNVCFVFWLTLTFLFDPGPESKSILAILQTSTTKPSNVAAAKLRVHTSPK